jgi:hypothetical protein
MGAAVRKASRKFGPVVKDGARHAVDHQRDVEHGWTPMMIIASMSIIASMALAGSTSSMMVPELGRRLVDHRFNIDR